MSQNNNVYGTCYRCGQSAGHGHVCNPLRVVSSDARIKCTVLNSTDKSIEICTTDELIVRNIPREFVLSEVRDGKTGLITEITIPQWLAKDRGLV